MISAGTKCGKLTGSQKVYCEKLMDECVSKAKSSGESPFELETCYTSKPLKLSNERMCGLLLPRLIGLKGDCPSDGVSKPQPQLQPQSKSQKSSGRNGDAAKSACGDLSDEKNNLCREMMSNCLDAADSAGGGKFEYKSCYSEKALKLSKPRMCKLLIPRLVSLKGLCSSAEAPTKTGTKAEIETKAEKVTRRTVKDAPPPAIVDKKAAIVVEKNTVVTPPPVIVGKTAVIAEDDSLPALVSLVPLKKEVWHPSENEDETDIGFKRGVVELTSKNLKTEWRNPMLIVVSGSVETDEFVNMVNKELNLPEAKDAEGNAEVGRIGILDWNFRSHRRIAQAIGVPCLIPGKQHMEWKVTGKFVGDKFVGKVESGIEPDNVKFSGSSRV